MRTLLCASLALAGIGIPHRRVEAQHRPALDLTLGRSAGSGGGPARSRTGLAADVVVTGPLKRLGRGALLGGVALGIEGPVRILGSDPCDAYVPSDRPPCDPLFPIFYSAVALAGWEAGGPRMGSLRILAGPGYYVQPDSGSTLGLQARVDLATPTLLRLALVASARGAILPRHERRTLRLGAVAVGLRVR